MFVAGASGVIGLPLCKMLLVAGYEVYGTTRSAAKAEMLAAQGIKPVVADAFDCGGLIVFAPLQFVLNFAQTLATSTMQPIVPTPTMTLPFSKKR